MGQIMTSWFRQRTVAYDWVYGFGTNARKIASGDKRVYTGSQPKGKTEIPVKEYPR